VVTQTFPTLGPPRDTTGQRVCVSAQWPRLRWRAVHPQKRGARGGELTERAPGTAVDAYAVTLSTMPNLCLFSVSLTVSICAANVIVAIGESFCL